MPRRKQSLVLQEKWVVSGQKSRKTRVFWEICKEVQEKLTCSMIPERYELLGHKFISCIDYSTVHTGHCCKIRRKTTKTRRKLEINLSNWDKFCVFFIWLSRMKMSGSTRQKSFKLFLENAPWTIRMIPTIYPSS